MANHVAVQVLGGSTQTLEGVSNVGDVKAKMNLASHTATVNGEPANDCRTLSDYDFVSLSPAVKGG